MRSARGGLDRASHIATVVVQARCRCPRTTPRSSSGSRSAPSTRDSGRSCGVSATKGPSARASADFPSLVPSSPAGRVDLSASGRRSWSRTSPPPAVQWRRRGSSWPRRVARACAAAVEEEEHAIVRGALSAVLAARAERRAEGGVASPPKSTRASRGWHGSKESGPGVRAGSSFLRRVRSSSGRAGADAWRDCPRMTCEAAGTHEAVGTIGAAVAVARAWREGEVGGPLHRLRALVLRRARDMSRAWMAGLALAMTANGTRRAHGARRTAHRPGSGPPTASASPRPPRGGTITTSSACASGSSARARAEIEEHAALTRCGSRQGGAARDGGAQRRDRARRVGRTPDRYRFVIPRSTRRSAAAGPRRHTRRSVAFSAGGSSPARGRPPDARHAALGSAPAP